MERRAIEVRGIVQGVGFRPHVFRLAQRLALSGFVQNRTGTVVIEVEGEADSLDVFCEDLRRRPPDLARIESFSWTTRPLAGDATFRILSSDVDVGQNFVSPDMATCADCLRELFDPADRRYRYPFINCMNCGPRLTIITGAPYDRQQTTMASFTMCVQCRAEYDDPRNRRFHAQPIACPNCGPRLALYGPEGEYLEVPDPLSAFAATLAQGKIGALKGLGGYHLTCDARSVNTVNELRRRKCRDEKPFALMVRDLNAAEELCAVSGRERELLVSQRAPIVLLLRRPETDGLAAAVALENPYLGVMLPYTPLHHLLLEALSPAPLVMTSGNRSDEPIAYRDAQALECLSGIADLFLIHDRPIHVRCDDSVTRIIAAAESPVRRSRGVAPEPIRLPTPCPKPILAVGGQLKGAFALSCGSQALVSHHLGDLDHLEAYRALTRDVVHYERLFGIEPALIVHDLHPDYVSTRYATSRELPLLAVQHHHAHMAACMAEHGLDETVIGVTFDGAGLGTDGSIWGGEFLVGDCQSFHRAAHLRYVGMPGGERSVREPWRMAAAHLVDAECDLSLLDGIARPAELRMLKSMLASKFQVPQTSSVGRLFDAVSAMAGLRARASFEGQTAIELEWQAMATAPCGAYPWSISEAIRNCPSAANRAEESHCRGESPSSKPNGKRNEVQVLPTWIVDARPLISGVAADVAAGIAASKIARRFHTSIVDLIADICGRIRVRTDLSKVVLSGGAFMNAILTTESQTLLSANGFTVYCHHRVPPNDGGLSLGQLAIAAAYLASTDSRGF